jgi:uncharacterized membrane protein YphA (DoxX/SURF4 family)
MAYLTHETVLVFLLRVILGILFFFQGYDKVFNVKIPGVIEFFKNETAGKRIPGFILVLSAWFTSLAELICGALLIVGFVQTWSLYILGIDMILVCGAFSMLKPMWDMQLLFPRLILLAALLYFPAEWDVISLDYFLK